MKVKKTNNMSRTSTPSEARWKPGIRFSLRSIEMEFS